MLNASCVLIKRKMVNSELWSGHILGSYVTHVLHTARISDVECVLCVDKEKDGKCGAMERPYATIGSYVTHVLHTARISNVECFLCDDNEKDDKCGAMERPHD